MNDHERDSTELSGDAVDSARGDRKPYRKPSFRFEQVFETMALQCGKIDPTSQSCHMVRMAS